MGGGDMGCGATRAGKKYPCRSRPSQVYLVSGCTGDPDTLTRKYLGPKYNRVPALPGPQYTRGPSIPSPRIYPGPQYTRVPGLPGPQYTRAPSIHKSQYTLAPQHTLTPDVPGPPVYPGPGATGAPSIPGPRGVTPTSYQYNHENRFFRDPGSIVVGGMDGPGAP